MMIKIRFNLDKSAVVTLSIYALYFLSKELNWILDITHVKDYQTYLPWIDVLDTQIIIWNMYYFTFVMKSVYITIESQNYEEYQIRSKYCYY